MYLAHNSCDRHIVVIILELWKHDYFKLSFFLILKKYNSQNTAIIGKQEEHEDMWMMEGLWCAACVWLDLVFNVLCINMWIGVSCGDIVGQSDPMALCATNVTAFIFLLIWLWFVCGVLFPWCGLCCGLRCTKQTNVMWLSSFHSNNAAKCSPWGVCSSCCCFDSSFLPGFLLRSGFDGCFRSILSVSRYLSAIWLWLGIIGCVFFSHKIFLTKQSSVLSVATQCQGNLTGLNFLLDVLFWLMCQVLPDPPEACAVPYSLHKASTKHLVCP